MNNEVDHVTFITYHQLLLCTKFNSGDPCEIDFYEELRFEQINGKIIITVGIAGRLNKSLDTGAPFTISDEIAAELGITSSR